MRLAVVIVHGIGGQEPDFADPMIRELRDRLASRDRRPAEVAFRPILWADVVAPQQRTYLAAAQEAGRLDFMALRRWVVAGLGDAAAYQHVERPSSTYVAVHDRIREAMRSLWVDQLGEQPVPLVVIAHSMGRHVMSSYVWDTQRGADSGAGPDASPFERFEHLAGMVTLGTNIPLFTFAYDPVVPIDFPGSALAPEVAEVARWVNYYDRDDVLGYPLRPTSPGYREVVDADVEVNVGRLLASATPLSHDGYWTDDDVTRPVTDQLIALLDAV